MNTIGSKVKKIRKVHNMNQIEFSSTLGISQGRLSEIEQDKTKPSAETIIAIKEKFKVDLNWLLTINSLDMKDQYTIYSEISTQLIEMNYEELCGVLNFIKQKKM
jgi:transcriptional regulator with XRE-family HTH domain